MVTILLQSLYTAYIDVNLAYLNARLEETIYMEFPLGVGKLSRLGSACRLRKSLYGLK